MDHGRKIGRIEKPLISKKPKLPFVTVTDSKFIKDEPIVEDNRLRNWKKWLKIHQKQHQFIKEREDQSKVDVVMNSCEKIRPLVEMRNLMEHATIPVPDASKKNWGNPGFWKVPPRLSNRGNPCLPDVGPVLTKKELNLFPTFEYVDIPTSVKREKNLLNPLEKIPAWKRSSYLEKRKQELADTIAKLQPSIPEMADLAIGGQGFRHVERNAIHVPVISITDMSRENEDSEVKVKESPVNPGVVVTLKINDLEITRNEQSICESSARDPEEITCALKFFNKVNERSKKRIYLENKGTVAITYYWRNVTHDLETVPVFSSKNNASFFFNKNKALILPGQTTEFNVWFHKNQPGTFSESWRMETDPIISRASFIFRMWGYIKSEHTDTKKSLEIDVYLDQCIKNTTVREIIEEIICNVRSSKTPEPAYKSLYLEGELFRAKNPSYFYHPSLIVQFHNLHRSAVSAPDDSPWTLSLIDLRHNLLEIKNPELRNEMLNEFSDLCQQSLKPCLVNPTRNTKYTVVYNILCALANRMAEESKFVKVNCIIRDRNRNSLPDTGAKIIRDKRSSNALRSRNTPSKESTISTTSSNKRSSKSSKSSGKSSLVISEMKPKQATLDFVENAIYRETFYVRVYELLVETVEQISAVLDSLNNLNEPES